MFQRAEPVVEHPDVDSLARTLGQQLGKAPPGGVAPDDVVLKMDPVPGLGNHLEHGLVGVRPVDQQMNLVTGNRPAAGSTIDRARHRLLCRDQPRGGHGAPRPSILS